MYPCLRKIIILTWFLTIKNKFPGVCVHVCTHECAYVHVCVLTDPNRVTNYVVSISCHFIYKCKLVSSCNHCFSVGHWHQAVFINYKHCFFSTLAWYQSVFIPRPSWCISQNFCVLRNSTSDFIHLGKLENNRLENRAM